MSESIKLGGVCELSVCVVVEQSSTIFGPIGVHELPVVMTAERSGHYVGNYSFFFCATYSSPRMRSVTVLKLCMCFLVKKKRCVVNKNSSCGGMGG